MLLVPSHALCAYPSCMWDGMGRVEHLLFLPIAFVWLFLCTRQPKPLQERRWHCAMVHVCVREWCVQCACGVIRLCGHV
jgi:hypothetical protein